MNPGFQPLHLMCHDRVGLKYVCPASAPCHQTPDPCRYSVSPQSGWKSHRTKKKVCIYIYIHTPSRARSGTAWAKLHVQQELGEDRAEADLQEYLVLMLALGCCCQPLMRCWARATPSHPGQPILIKHTGGERRGAAGQGAALTQDSPAGSRCWRPCGKRFPFPIPAPSGDVPSPNTRQRWRGAMENRICARRDKTI